MRRAGPARGSRRSRALWRLGAPAEGRMRTDASGPSTEKRHGRTPLRSRDGQRDL